MRPDPHHRHPQSSPNRVISLGEVRRKRALRQRAPDRHYIAAMVLISLVAWGIWLTVLFTVWPSRLLTYLAFFAPLWVAVASTGAITAYGVDWRRGVVPGLKTCLRRGGLTASIVVLNLALRAAHHWSLAIAGASLLAALLIEVGMRRDL